MGTYDVRDFGARGDGSTNDAPAIQAAIDACAARGVGTVLVPAGATYLAGSILLRSFVDCTSSAAPCCRPAATGRTSPSGSWSVPWPAVWWARVPRPPGRSSWRAVRSGSRSPVPA